MSVKISVNPTSLLLRDPEIASSHNPTTGKVEIDLLESINNNKMEIEFNEGVRELLPTLFLLPFPFGVLYAGSEAVKLGAKNLVHKGENLLYASLLGAKSLLEQ